MSGIYPLDTEKNLILYPSQNTLYLRTTLGESVTRPVTLCADYGKNLSDTIHNGTIYYCYQNIRNDIVVRSITDLQELYHIGSMESPDCFNPVLVSFKETLFLFYVIKNPVGGDYYIKTLLPFAIEKHISITDKRFAYCPKLSAFIIYGGILLYANDEKTQSVFYMDNNFACRELNISEDTTAQYDIAQMEATQNTLHANIEALTKELAARDSIIESVKKQYAELMETATKYKAEAAKWHDLAYKKDARPLPGERLLTDEW